MTMALEASETDLQQAVTKFGIALYDSLRQTPGNIAFSQMSAHSILLLLQQAAAGSTKETLEIILGTDDPESFIKIYEDKISKISGFNIENTVTFANKIYLKSELKLKQKFRCKIEKQLQSEIEGIDFSDSTIAAEKITKWVYEKTYGKIDNIVNASNLIADTNLMLINALHFKDAWFTEFDKEETRTEPFYVDSDNQIDVQMMHLKLTKIHYAEDELLDAKLIALPYFSKQIQMILILPKDKNGIRRLEENLPKVDLPKLINKLSMYKCYVTLPKFRIEQETKLATSLKSMGAHELFVPGKCNLSDMTEDSGNIAVDEIIQKTVIDVHEEGTEATSTTSLRLRKLAGWVCPLRYFFADHPFIFKIVYYPVHKKTELVIPLFMGKVARPEYPGVDMAPRGTPLVEGFADKEYYEQNPEGKEDDI